MENNQIFEFLRWVTDNGIPRVSAKSNQYFDRWIVLPEGQIHPLYLIDNDLLDYWQRNINHSVELTDESNDDRPMVPVAGMGATLSIRSDSYPYTIHRVSRDLKQIWISPDNHKWIPDDPKKLDGNGHYEYSNNNAGRDSAWQLFTRRKNGRYVMHGVGMRQSGVTLTIGHRSYYQDPSF